jgi:hypothetical protein
LSDSHRRFFTRRRDRAAEGKTHGLPRFQSVSSWSLALGIWSFTAKRLSRLPIPHRQNRAHPRFRILRPPLERRSVQITQDMTKAPLSERLEFFKFQYACQTFAHARKILLYIQDHKVLASHPLHYTLWTAFIVLYGKPFRQRNPLRLDTNIVSVEFRDVHQSLQDLRDKMFAHADLDLVSQSLDPLNSIVVMIEGADVKMGTGFIYGDPATTSKYRSLVELLIQKTNHHANRLWTSWDVIAHRTGRYVINVGKESDDILLPIRWAAGSYLEPNPPASPESKLT